MLDLSVINAALGKQVSFDIYPSAIIKESFQDVTVLGVGSHDMMLGHSVAELHAKVYPTLPEGTINNDYRSYLYVLIRFPVSGKTAAVGLPWIKADSFKALTVTDINITLLGVDSTMIPFIQRMLTANGFGLYRINTVSK